MHGLAQSLIWLVFVPVVHLTTLPLALIKTEAWTFVRLNALTSLARKERPAPALYLVPDATRLGVLGINAIRRGPIPSIRLMNLGEGHFLTPNLAASSG